MDTAVNAGQVEFWNTDAGQRWVTQQEFMDTLLAPVLDRLLEAADVNSGDHVLDIGCGTGASVMAWAERVGPEGSVQGCDISDTMLNLAKIRVAEAGFGNTELTLADAQVFAFDAEKFDHAVSRFGVMFFDDPVIAFSNISNGLRSGGQLTFIAWAPVTKNPWFKIAYDASVARLGPMDVAADPDAPGPMGFQDAERVLSILKHAGFVGATSKRVAVDLDAGPSLKTATDIAMTLGPAVRFLTEKNATQDDADAIAEQVKEKLAQYQTANGLQIPSDLILFQATKP